MLVRGREAVRLERKIHDETKVKNFLEWYYEWCMDEALRTSRKIEKSKERIEWLNCKRRWHNVSGK